MQLHISDCTPCQAFIHSLEETVERCRAYQPGCTPERSAEARKQLVRQYLQAAAALKFPSRKRVQSGTPRH